ncbi:MAG: hypothetical protein JXJ20_02375 [Anaerolineae bacterium]|nr:hypothetical protein [Anaerolineae bacterium]
MYTDSGSANGEARPDNVRRTSGIRAWLDARRANLRALWHTSAFQLPTRLWLGWVIVLLLFQSAAWMRLDVVGPDTAYGWTDQHSVDTPKTGIGLSHVRWDSYHYLRLARLGYHDTQDAAYYPAYPVLMRIAALGIVRPLLPHTVEIDQYAIGGLIISIVASLAATWALFRLFSDLLGDELDALRATFYLLIFPTALFLTQVYTESLYLALATPALIFMIRRQWWAAGLLATLATITRATGVLIVGAMALDWWLDRRRGERPPWHTLVPMLLPVLAWQVHTLLLADVGLNMHIAQRNYGRVLFDPDNVQIILDDIGYMLTHAMGAVHISLDIALTALAAWACWRVRREWPDLALYGAASLAVPLATGQLVSMNRYALIMLPTYLVLARYGRSPLFDKLWTLVSVLLLALYLVGFAHGYWTG